MTPENPNVGPPTSRHNDRTTLLLCVAVAVLALLYVYIYGLPGSVRIPTAQLRLTCYPLIFAVYLTAVWLAIRHPHKSKGSRAHLLVILVGAIAIRCIPLLGAVPSNPDLHRHLWEGRVLLSGLNPYAAAPQHEVYDALRAELEADGDDLYSGKWLKYKHIRSVYGPLATALFAVPHLLPFDRVVSLRVIMTGLDIGTIALLIALLAALRLPPSYVIVYAWSPVTINGFADRGQVDAALVVLIVLSALLVVRKRPALAGIAFAGALLVKVSPLLLALPLLRWGRWRFASGAAAALLIGILPFMGAGTEGLSGFAAFADRWRENDPVYSLLIWALEPLSAAFDIKAAIRILLALVATAYATIATVRLRANDGRHLMQTMACICAAVIMLSPVTYPWYGAVMIAFLCFYPRAHLLALSLAPMFWYMRFIREPAAPFWEWVVSMQERWRQPWRVPVYGVVALVWIASVLRDRRRRRDPNLS